MSDARRTPGLHRANIEAAPKEATEGATQEFRSSPEELDLVARLRAGDDAAFARLMERYHGGLLRLAEAFVSSRAVAEEVVQETWVGVIEGLATFEGRSSVKTWIFSILTNRAKTRGVREGRSVPFSSMSDPDGESEPLAKTEKFNPTGTRAVPPCRWEDETPEKLLMHREALQLLEAAIKQLPPNQRTVVTLRDIEGLGPVEVCNILQIGDTHQRVLLHRARSKLRRALEEFLHGT